MWTVEDSNLGEQNNCDATTFALADLCAKFDEQGLYVFPGDVRAGRVSVEGLERALVLALHEEHGTRERYRACRGARF